MSTKPCIAALSYQRIFHTGTAYARHDRVHLSQKPLPTHLLAVEFKTKLDNVR